MTSPSDGLKISTAGNVNIELTNGDDGTFFATLASARLTPPGTAPVDPPDDTPKDPVDPPVDPPAPTDSRFATVYDIGLLRPKVNAAVTLDQIAQAFNTTAGAFYGVTLKNLTKAGTLSGMVYSAVSAADLEHAKWTAIGIASGLSHYPQAYIQGLPFDTLGFVHDLHDNRGTAVAVTVAPNFYWNLPAVADEAQAVHTLHHELMHIAESSDRGYWGLEYTNGTNTHPAAWIAANAAPYGGYGHRGQDPNNAPTSFPSNYGVTCFAEDLAEVMTELWEPGNRIYERIQTDAGLKTKVRILVDWLNGRGVTVLNGATGFTPNPPTNPTLTSPQTASSLTVTANALAYQKAYGLTHEVTVRPNWPFVESTSTSLTLTVLADATWNGNAGVSVNYRDNAGSLHQLANTSTTGVVHFKATGEAIDTTVRSGGWEGWYRRTGRASGLKVLKYDRDSTGYVSLTFSRSGVLPSDALNIELCAVAGSYLATMPPLNGSQPNPYAVPTSFRANADGTVTVSGNLTGTSGCLQVRIYGGNDLAGMGLWDLPAPRPNGVTAWTATFPLSPYLIAGGFGERPTQFEVFLQPDTSAYPFYAPAGEDAGGAVYEHVDPDHWSAVRTFTTPGSITPPVVVPAGGSGPFVIGGGLKQGPSTRQTRFS